MADRVVLVVDDDEDVGEFLRLVMQEEFAASVLLTGDSREAKQLAREAHPALALVDISGPGRLRLVAEMKGDAATSAMPIIGITIPGERSEALRAGAAYCLDKPFDLDLLIDVVGKCLEKPAA